MNLAAFAWGRCLAVDPAAVLGRLVDKPADDDPIESRANFLIDYQNAAYAARYRAALAEVAQAEAAAAGSGQLAAVAARGLFRVMAYKDEYEVARLYTDGAFARALESAFEGKPKLTFHLAAPGLARRDRATGEPRKRAFGGWMLPVFKALARIRGLRGTRLDPFGLTAERRAERAMIPAYEALLGRLNARLCADNLAQAAQIASLVLEVRGYGHVKEKARLAYQPRVAEALENYESQWPLAVEARAVAA